MNKSKRDELAHEYMNSIFRLEPYQEPPDFDECFKHGYSAGYAEAQEQAKVLVEALESIEWTTSYSDGSKDHCKADRTLVESALSKLEGMK